MADFKTHLIRAAAVSGMAATSLMLAGVGAHQHVMTYFVLGTVGRLLPDVDSKSSVPFRVAFNLLAVVCAFLTVLHFGGHYSLLELIILWAVCFAGIRYGLCPLFVNMTVHRGLVHSIPAGVIAGLLSVLLAARGLGFPVDHAWLCGLFVFLGFVVHLLLDEIYSVNLFGMKLKRSFGAAFWFRQLEESLGYHEHVLGYSGPVLSGAFAAAVPGSVNEPGTLSTTAKPAMARRRLGLRVIYTTVRSGLITDFPLHAGRQQIVSR
ncbi:MAG: metal-dependent hydrolase [Candidatus Competibacteraceae bacterium]